MRYEQMNLCGKCVYRMVRGGAHVLMLALLAFCLLPRPGLAADSERIESFDSVVRIQADGTLLVEETITATALGETIKRGIYRDFPLRYTGAGGYGGDVPFEVLSVTLDGKQLDPGDVEHIGGGLRIFMRAADPLPHGEHTFVLNYATSMHVRQFEDADELNWNVTGAGWAMPIEQVSCVISLPAGGVIDKVAGWLGEEGSMDSPLIMEQTAPNEMYFAGEAPVQPGEEFTVAVSFPKGVVTEKTPEPRLLDKLFALNTQLWFKGILIVLSIGYYVLTWFTWGRDPKPGPIVPLFHAPEVDGTGQPLSSVATPFILECRKLTNDGFASLFLSLALRGLCTITKTDKGFSIQPHAQNKATQKTVQQLSEEERAAYDILMIHAHKSGRVDLDSEPSPAMHEVHTAVLEKLEARYNDLWKPNEWIMYVGVAIVLPFCFMLGLGTPDGMWEMALTGAVFGGALVYITGNAKELLKALMQRKILFSAGLGFIAFLLWLSFDSFSELSASLSSLFAGGLDPDDALLLALFLPPVIFQRLVKAPSPACRALMDRIEGFQMYIDTAEKNRIAAFNGPDETPAVFQEVLPYAVALGLTATWCSRFADQLASGLIVNDNIRLDDWNGRSFNRFVDRFSSSAAAVSGGGKSSSGSAFSSGGGGAGSGSGGGGGGGC